MSSMKCPYCEKPLHCGAQLDSDGHIIELYQCANPECESTEFLVGCKEFWDILGQHRRTHKALNVAVDVLKEMADWYPDVCDKVAETMDEITALEQKE